MPESMKSMFRNVTCVTPDIELICAVTLISDGFLDAKVNFHIVVAAVADAAYKGAPIRCLTGMYSFCILLMLF